MANGRFVVDRHGYGYVLNAAPEIGTYCQLEGERLAASASHQSGVDFTVDTQHGFTRWHTRVSSPSMHNADGGWNRDAFREGNLRSLPVALTQWGGSTDGFTLKPRPYKASGRRR